MATGFYKSLVFASGLILLAAACGGVNDVATSNTSGGAGSSGGGSASVGAAGTGGSLPVAGSTATAGGGAGGSSAGSSAGGGVGGLGGAAASGSAGQGVGGGGVAGSAGTGGAAGAAGMGGAGGSGGAAPFALTSPAFTQVEACSQQNHAACMLIPLKNAMTAIGGQNISPELDWGPSPGAKSYVITLHDFTNNFTHWAIWNIPAATLMLPENLARVAMPPVPAGSQQKSFNMPDPGYMGPGAKDHIYEFRLYALKVTTFTPQDATDQGKIYNELETDTAKIVIGKAMLRGRSPS